MKYVVMTGYAGDAGSAELYQTHREELSSRFAPTYSKRFETLDGVGEHVIEADAICRIPITDGVYSGLWRLGEAGGCGLEIIHGDIPIRQETIEICEALGENPYELASSGALYLMNERPDFGTIIGSATDDRAKTIVMRSGLRYLARPRAD